IAAVGAKTKRRRTVGGVVAARGAVKLRARLVTSGGIVVSGVAIVIVPYQKSLITDCYIVAAVSRPRERPHTDRHVVAASGVALQGLRSNCSVAETDVTRQRVVPKDSISICETALDTI